MDVGYFLDKCILADAMEQLTVCLKFQISARCDVPDLSVTWKRLVTRQTLTIENVYSSFNKFVRFFALFF